MSYVLTAPEAELVAAVEDGMFKRYEGEADGIPLTRIRAETLRRILLGLPVLIGDVERPVEMRGNGLNIYNAYIEDELRLDNGCFANGDPLPRLSLEDCYIPKMMSLLSCRIRRLCLRNTRLTYLRANDAVIGSQLDIEGVRSCRTVAGAQSLSCCRISLRGAHIEDGIEARNAELVCVPARDGYMPYEDRSRYALDLAGLTTGGDIRLFPRFKAYGGVNLSGANVTGSVQAHGAHLTREEVSAMDLDGAHISGKLALCARRTDKGANIEPFTAIGDIDLSGATIGNNLNMRGAKIDGNIHADYVRVASNMLLNGADGYCGGKPCIERFVCSGTIQLNGAKIEGSIDFSGARVGGQISASTATLGGDFLAALHVHKEDAECTSRFEAHGPMVLDGLRIQSDLNFDCAALPKGLQAKGLHVQGFCQMRSRPYPSPHVFECGGPLNISNSEIGLDFDMSGASLNEGMDARNIIVGGNFRLRMAHISNSAPHERPFTSVERVNISGAEIKGDLDIYYAELQKGLRARGVKVSSALVIRLLDVPRTPDRYNIDLTNARANVVVDGPGNGGYYGANFLLALEGFTYGRFIVAQDDNSSTNPYTREALRGSVPDTWKDRLVWLRKQYTQFDSFRALKIEYKADTYTTLYQALRNNGLMEEANRVLIEKLRIEGKLKPFPLNFINWVFEVICGFGLRPGWAVLWTCLYSIVIAIFVAQANGRLGEFSLPATPWAPVNAVETMVDGSVEGAGHLLSDGLTAVKFGKGVLVAQGAPVSRMLAHGDKAPVQDYFQVDGPGADHVEKVPCGTRVSAPLYALDMIVPGVEFNQVNKCDFAEDSGLFWLTFKALATLLGWFLTSATALTLSGIVRRQIEPK